MRHFKVGTWICQRGYKSFQPAPINQQWVPDDMEVQRLFDRDMRLYQS